MLTAPSSGEPLPLPPAHRAAPASPPPPPPLFENIFGKNKVPPPPNLSSASLHPEPKRGLARISARLCGDRNGRSGTLWPVSCFWWRSSMRADVSMRSRLRVRRLQVSALTTFDTSGRGGWGGKEASVSTSCWLQHRGGHRGYFWEITVSQLPSFPGQFTGKNHHN